MSRTAYLLEQAKQEQAQLLNQQRVAITGQQTPPPAADWPMSNRASALRLNALEPALALLGARLDTLLTSMATQSAAFALRLSVAEANATLSLANDAQAVTSSAAAQAKADAADSKALAAQADIALLKVRATQDEAAIATAQQTAVQARTLAEADAAAATEAKTLATQAKAQVTQAQADLLALQARFRVKLVTTPAVTLTAGSAKTVGVLWDTPFADDKYALELTAAGANLVGIRATYTDKTATGFTLVLTNIGSLPLTLTTGAVDAAGLHP